MNADHTAVGTDPKRKGEDGGRIVEEGGDEVAVKDVTRIQT